MRLRSYRSTLDEKLSEFDIWVTPSLGEIRDTPQFKVNLAALQNGFDMLGQLTEDFKDPHGLSPRILAANIVDHIAMEPLDSIRKLLADVFRVLLLATGKTDNNLKCQFPLLLRNAHKIYRYPVKGPHGIWQDRPLPRTITMEDSVKIIASLTERAEYQTVFAESYLRSIISDELYAKQVWCLGRAYISQKESGSADLLISSIAIFQSRGSITADLGHIPESILRDHMRDWGLEAGEDFNLQDVEIGKFLTGIDAPSWAKKRKYDFIIPYRSRSDGAKIFIQSQFYAGDSGSVSHKVVDQTDSTRETTLRRYPHAVFIEYLDGAGYFSSLNGDLKKMLAKPTTKDFIQIRTAPVKLRRELQEIHFLTLLEIEHAVLCTDGDEASVRSFLLDDGYPDAEIDRVLRYAFEKDRLLRSAHGSISIRSDRVEIVRRYCILDLIANRGRPVSSSEMGGALMIAGYQADWGILQADLVQIALETIPGLDALWGSKLAPFQDIQWLLKNGFVAIR